MVIIFKVSLTKKKVTKSVKSYTSMPRIIRNNNEERKLAFNTGTT